MARKPNYPIGSISSGTMREEDLIPDFCYELNRLARQTGILNRKERAAHRKLVREIESRMESEDYYGSADSSDDLNETLFNALDEYAAPYFYFGAHPGDGADYGFWLSEDWDEDFREVEQSPCACGCVGVCKHEPPMGLKVSDTAEVPKWYRGEVAHVNDHGNVTLYVQNSRGLREIWGVV